MKEKMPFYVSICHGFPLHWWDGKLGQCSLCFEWKEGREATQDETNKYNTRPFRFFR